MRSFVTSYSGLFALKASGIRHIEIPMIQRDYAQGREGGGIERIRDSFLEVLHRAVTGGERLSLDFIYGEVDENGTLRPLDGQQRLTTLFLLHWYLAWRADRVGQEGGWKRFTYATRASARRFCERLVEQVPPPEVAQLSAWIEDQPWYLHPWRQDPTIQSMLVMLDAMHQRFRGDDCTAAWARLVHPEEPAISFHLLPIGQDLGASEDLYIKMNARGKPLTPFEHFKARFEQTLEATCRDRVGDFALRVDGPWSDLLWPYRGADSIIDDEFLRYFRFVTEICEWREGRQPAGEIGDLADRVYGRPDANAQLDFLFRAFDTWVGVDIAGGFESLFAARPSGDDPQKVVLYGQGTVETDLFAACCRRYGEARGHGRTFGLPDTLLLYAVVLHRLSSTPDFARRLRVLRNLIEASGNELRLERMPVLIADVGRILDGRLADVTAFNRGQVADEQAKAKLLSEHPGLESALFQLEDHPLLRGCLTAFDLDEAAFAQRADAFHQIFSDTSEKRMCSLTGALLAIGDYSRRFDHRFFQLGSASYPGPWRELLTGATRSDLARAREAWMQLLDEVAQAGDVDACLETVQLRWLTACEESAAFCWRYYLVKYSAMREGRSGIYVGPSGARGYELCMLDKRRVSSWYRDPYLLAIYRESGAPVAVEEPWFTGYETQPRWLHLAKSGSGLRCIDAGIALRPPQDAAHAEVFAPICQKHGVGTDHELVVPQTERDGRLTDGCDRVQLGATLLRDLVEAGL